MSTSTSSSSLTKKTQNKIYTKEINYLIEKIIKSKRNAFRFSKVHGCNPNNISKGHISSNLDRSSNKDTEIKSVKITKQYNPKCLNKSGNSSMNEGVSISLIGASNAKINEYNKQIREIIDNKSINDRCSELIIDILSYLKSENNLSNVIFDNDAFITNIFELFSLINFAGVKTTPNYKVTDMNYNLIEGSLSKSVIEEFALNMNDNDTNGAISPQMIRIKNEHWKDILNLYDILITLLNNIPTVTILISKMPLEFISNLVFSINTMDNEERVLIKMLIYKIYISSLTFRKYIIKMISNIIIDISHDEHNKLLCLTECLDLLKCILLGAKRPINDYYLSVVNNVICPLLKCKVIFKNALLKETLIKLMNYDSRYLNVILSFLLRTWPIRYPERIIIYLDIIDSIFTNEDKDTVSQVEEDLLLSIIKKVRCCFSDLSFLIADRSLIFFKNENFIVLLYKYNKEKDFLLKLVENIEKHWSQEIKIISRIVISKLTKRDEKILSLLSEKEKKIIDEFKFDMTDSEDIWDVQFNLKGD